MISFLSTLIAHPIIPLFLFLNLAIGFWAHTKAKANSFEDYALASRSLPTGVLVMTLLGTFVATGDLFFPDAAFKYGIVQSLSAIAFVISFLLIGTFIAPHLVHFSECTTIGDLMRTFYGTTAQIITGIVGSMVGLLIVSSQIRSIGTISSHLLNIDSSIAILCLGSLVVIYSLWGGMRVVSYTDIMQIIAALLVLSWVTNRVIQEIGGLPLLWQKLSSNHPDKATIFGYKEIFYRIKSSIFWSISCTLIFTLPVVQRMLMTQDKRKVRYMWYVSACLYALICFMTIVIGLGVIVGRTQFDLIGKSENLLLHLINNLFRNRLWVIDLMFIGFLGILFSTMDSYLHAIAISLVHDVANPIRSFLGVEKWPLNKKTTYARIALGVAGIIAVFASFVQGISLFSRDFYQYSVVISAMIITPLIIGILGLKTDKISPLSFALFI